MMMSWKNCIDVNRMSIFGRKLKNSNAAFFLLIALVTFNPK
jgi:hypothetical protein